MPIKVDIHNNTSQIQARRGYNINDARLEALIKEETEERIEADADLQAQILNKEDKIKYIELLFPVGVLDEELLNLLISNRLNRLVYENNYYMLSTKDNRYWVYMGQTTDPNTINTISVDTETGEWVYSLIGNAALQNHINDNGRHLMDGEREFWNNKINLELSQDELLEFNRN